MDNPFDDNPDDADPLALPAFPKVESRNDEKYGNCYCGKDRNLNILELLCANCSKWHHESCIGFQLGKLIPFATNYIFVCKNCSPTGVERFRKSQTPMAQMCITAIANMQQAALKDGNKRFLFDKDDEIIPFIEQYWESMTTMPRRVTQSWYATVSRALTKDIDTIFKCYEEDNGSQKFGLIVTDLQRIKPNYEAMVKGGMLKITDDGYAQEKKTRKPKTTPHQISIYLNFMESNPEVISRALDAYLLPDHYNNKWKSLTSMLNSTKSGPRMTQDEWRKRFTDYKNSLRSKQRILKGVTKGEVNRQLTPLEERALSLFDSIESNTDATSINNITEPCTKFDEDSIEADEYKDTDASFCESNDKIDQGKSDEEKPLTSDEENEDKDEEKPLSSFRTVLPENPFCENSSPLQPVGKIEHPLKRKKSGIGKSKISSIHDLESTHNKHMKQLIKLKKRRLRFEIASFKYLHPDFVFEDGSSSDSLD